MNALLQTLSFEVLRYATMAYDTLMTYWILFWDWYSYIPLVAPSRRYFLSTSHTFNDSYTKVPPDTVYVEEWIRGGDKKCVIRYENEAIPQTWNVDPFSQSARCPWLWVGDRSTEIDLTRTFNKFLVPGNRILVQLVEKLIQINDQTNLIYIEAGSFKEMKFPGDGLLIKANGDD